MAAMFPPVFFPRRSLDASSSAAIFVLVAYTSAVRAGPAFVLSPAHPSGELRLATSVGCVRISPPARPGYPRFSRLRMSDDVYDDILDVDGVGDDPDDALGGVLEAEFRAAVASMRRREMDVGEGGAGNSSLVLENNDWADASTSLSRRAADLAAGRTSPKDVLFRQLTSDLPSEGIRKFISGSSPVVLNAMSDAVGALMGGLANPAVGAGIVVKADGEKLAALCFQLQMTGYMFRNVEYVLALRELLNLSGQVSGESYKEAFDKIDEDGSGYIESREVAILLEEVYGKRPPDFEVRAFLQFFDRNSDGRISWEEFQKGLGVIEEANKREGQGWGPKKGNKTKQLAPSMDLPEPKISGEIELEMEDGSKIAIDAKEYIDALKAEAQELKQALGREAAADLSPLPSNQSIGGLGGAEPSPASEASIPGYLSTLRPDNVKALTEGIGTEVVETMRMLVDFVLNGGQDGQRMDEKMDKKKQVSLAGNALQKLALWQLILGYRLREEEAKGDYKKISSR